MRARPRPGTAGRRRPRRRRDPRPRRAPEQPPQSRHRLSHRRVHRRHRCQRLRQVLPRLRHRLRRRPAPLHGDLFLLRAHVPRTHGSTGRRRRRRHPARHRHPPDQPRPHVPLHRRNDDRTQRPHQAALRQTGAPLLPRLQPRSRRRHARHRLRQTPGRRLRRFARPDRLPRRHPPELHPRGDDRPPRKTGLPARLRRTGRPTARGPGPRRLRCEPPRPHRRVPRSRLRKRQGRPLRLQAGRGRLGNGRAEVQQPPELPRLRAGVPRADPEPLLLQFARRRVRTLPRLRPHDHLLRIPRRARSVEKRRGRLHQALPNRELHRMPEGADDLRETAQVPRQDAVAGPVRGRPPLGDGRRRRLGGARLVGRQALLRLARIPRLQDARARHALPLPRIPPLPRLRRLPPQARRAELAPRRRRPLRQHPRADAHARRRRARLLRSVARDECHPRRADALRRDPAAPRLPPRRRPRLPDPRPPVPHAQRRRGPAHQPHAGPRQLARQHALRPRRAEHRPPPARRRPPDLGAQAPPRRRQHGARRRTRPGRHRRGRPRHRNGPRPRRTRRQHRLQRPRPRSGRLRGERDGALPLRRRGRARATPARPRRARPARVACRRRSRAQPQGRHGGVPPQPLRRRHRRQRLR